MGWLDSAIVLLLLAGFVLGAFSHYRAALHPESSTLTWPFGIGLAALLFAFVFLLGAGFWPGWTSRRQLFVVIAPVQFCAALAYFLRQRARSSA